MLPLAAVFGLALVGYSRAEVTIYTTVAGLNGAASTTSTAAIPYTTGNSAYSQLVLTPPTPPTGLNSTWPITVYPASQVANLSMPQKGNFMGFSVELSVVGQVMGLNSTFLQPPFLNYLANIKERAGAGPTIRVGGNTQDQSIIYPDTFIDKWGHPQMLEKTYSLVNGNPTGTPNISYAYELFYQMGNITKLLDVDWFFGVQFSDPYNNSNALLAADLIEEQLGDHLISLQLGNEPDLYGGHGHRPSNYSIQDYFTEYEAYLEDLDNSDVPDKKVILGPSICCTWTTDEVFDAGYLTEFANYLNTVGLIHYPNDNCGIGGVTTSQSILASFLTHQSAIAYVQNYAGIIPQAQAAGLPIIMLETNTASCGGFPGMSDAFTAPLWAIDNALLMAANNFTNMLIHIGGQSDSYNPFTPPPSNLSTTHGWTTGPIYYSLLAVAEALGSSNASQVVDLGLQSEFRPGYAIYEQGSPTKLALINYASDDTGASDYDAVINFAGANVPDNVYVRHLAAPSVVEKWNITWAGQSMGGAVFNSDGRLSGDVVTQTIECDTVNNVCTVPMRAPSFALIFLTQQTESESTPSYTQTFATTATTNPAGHPAIDPAVLATMNGEGGPGARYTGSTAKGALSAGIGLRELLPAAWSLAAVVAGCLLVTLGRA